MSGRNHRSLAVIGGGPAGLMAAEVARAAGIEVDVYDRMGSVGRKFLIAGKGGLNLTHSESFDAFVGRYGDRSALVATWLRAFDADRLRAWARELGVETFVGSSGRVFPLSLKAAPLLRGWVRRLRASGVRFHVNHDWHGWDAAGALRFRVGDDARSVSHGALVLACGGGSWPVLGSDGAWVPRLQHAGIDVAPLQPSNCGFDVDWSAHLATRHAGQPVKPVVIEWTGADGVQRRQGEFVITASGVEGSLIYAFSGAIRDAIARAGPMTIRLDLSPGREQSRLERDLAKPRAGRTLSEHLRRQAGIDGVKAALVFEVASKADQQDPVRLASIIKALPLMLQRERPLAEAISSAGGVRVDALDGALMCTARPGVFCAGEMIDWEAPTGGYLLAACFASGRIAGQGAARWIGATI
ncbi:MAG: TIGR03862 family flavoprotein [Dokdonella sp.]|uniref:TIGR03862 family flavoprotein n=1 Tax=Dokdonella sp. TaxID=2291710 RepID=UPI003264985C